MLHFRAGSFATCFCVAMLAAMGCASTHAETWSDNLYLNGYFTLDMTYADSDLNVVSSSSELRHYNEDKISIKNSLIGGQLEYQVSDNLSIFAQGSAFYDEHGSARTDLNWAYLSYDFGYDLKARVGVFQTPFLQGTELRTVGYSRIWARPLTPGSGASGLNEYIGVDFLKQVTSGDDHWDFQLALGQAEHDLEEVDNKTTALFATRYQHQQFWIRAALMHSDYSVLTPRGQLITDTGHVLMGSVEAEATFGRFIVNGGYSTSNADVTPNDTMHYLSLAYAFDDITPFIFTAKRNQHFVAFEVPEPELRPNGPPPVQPPPPPPDGDANVYSFAAGLRWNISEHLAFKVQAEHIRKHDDSHEELGLVAETGNALTLVLEGAF